MKDSYYKILIKNKKDFTFYVFQNIKMKIVTVKNLMKS